MALIDGLLNEITRGHAIQALSYSALPGDERELVRWDVGALRGLVGGYGIEGVRRRHLLDALARSAQARGVPIVYGHQLVEVETRGEGVVARFANGQTVEGSFLVGCDGLHSNTRAHLFGRENATYTGLTQVR